MNVRTRTTPAMRDMVVLKPRHLGNVSDGTRRRSDFRTAPNYRRDNRDKRRKKDDVITGFSRNFSLQGSFPQGRAKYRECVGVFVSRLHKDTRVRHVEQGSYIPGNERFLYTYANALKRGRLVVQ